MRKPVKYLPLVAFLLLVVLPAASLADQLTRTNGAILDGRVVSEDKDFVTFEISSGGISMRQRIPRAQIKSLQREVLEGPGYCALPLSGEIGVEVTADAVRRAFEAARQAKPDYVILVIDSPGGRIDEMVKIVRVIADNHNLRPIAYIRRALSAAAVIAVACPEIYMSPEATIGAAVPFKIGPDNTPQNIEEKFQSALRAHMRATAKVGGHSELLIRAMIEPDLQLVLENRDGKPLVREATGAELTDPASLDGPTLIKKKGQILTMTAREALDCGLSRATIDTLDSVKKPLGLKAWHKASDQPWFILANRARIARQQAEADARHHVLVRQATPQLAEIQAALDKATARHNSAQRDMGKVQSEAESAVMKLRSEYQKLISAARIGHDIDRIRQLEAEYKEKGGRIIDDAKTAMAALETTRDQATQEIQQLLARRAQLMEQISNVDQ